MRRAPSLQYIDLSSSSKSPIGLVWNGIFYELNKENAIKIEQDADHFYVVLELVSFRLKKDSF